MYIYDAGFKWFLESGTKLSGLSKNCDKLPGFETLCKSINMVLVRSLKVYKDGVG